MTLINEGENHYVIGKVSICFLYTQIHQYKLVFFEEKNRFCSNFKKEYNDTKII